MWHIKQRLRPVFEPAAVFPLKAEVRYEDQRKNQLVLAGLGCLLPALDRKAILMGSSSFKMSTSRYCLKEQEGIIEQFALTPKTRSFPTCEYEAVFSAVSEMHSTCIHRCPKQSIRSHRITHPRQGLWFLSTCLSRADPLPCFSAQFKTNPS